MEELKTKLIESLLSTMTYDEMTEEQEKLVTEYETENWKPRVDELRKRLSPDQIKEQIHNWWSDYEFSDGTEENLLAYV